MTSYHVTLVKDEHSHSNLAAIELIEGDVGSRVNEAGSLLYGMFAPLFGLSSNELYVVTRGKPVTEMLSGTTLVAKSSTEFLPTARPSDHTARTRPGIYVFRWFDIHTRDIDEIVRLSTEAWVTFESGFDTEVQCLFRQPPPGDDVGRMLLITWYTDLSVWEASRSPSAEARENFIKRARLTLQATPICTRLVTSSSWKGPA